MPQTRNRARWVIICDPIERGHARFLFHEAKKRNLRVRCIDVSHKLRPYPIELADATGLVLCLHRPDGHARLFESFEHLDKLQSGVLIVAVQPERYPEALRKKLGSLIRHVHYFSLPHQFAAILRVMKQYQILNEGEQER